MFNTVKTTQIVSTYKGTDSLIVRTLDFSKGIILEDLIAKSNIQSDLFILVLFVKGSAGVKINLKELSLAKGDLLIIPPDATKEQIFISEDAVLKIVAYTTGFIAQQNLPENFWEITEFYSVKHKTVWSLSKSVAKDMTNLIDQMETRLFDVDQYSYKYAIVSHYFIIFVLELVNLAPQYALDDNQQFTRREALTIQFFALAKKHFREQKSLSFYAEALFVTPKHLTETVKEVSKRTAGDIINLFLLQAAKIQLRTTMKSIAEIADWLNFSDQSAFGKFFKRMEGISPKTYRSKHV